MERSRHRIRTLPTEDLVLELVTAMIDAMETSELERLDSPRARRVFAELRTRQDARRPKLEDDCACSDCLGDLYQGEGGPGPFG